MSERRINYLWLSLALLGGAVILMGVGSSLLAFFLPGESMMLPEQIDMSIAVFTAIGVLGVGFGLSLLITGLRAGLNPAPVSFYPRRRWWIPILLFLLSVGAGVALSLDGGGRIKVIALVHVALIVLPAFILLVFTSLLAGQEGAAGRRNLVLTTNAGAFATLLAFPLEIIGLLLSGIAVGAATVAIPGGVAEFERLQALLTEWMSAPRPTISEEQLLSLIRSPIVLGVLILTLAVVTPFVEEIVKTLIITPLTYYKRPNARRAFLWGAGCGLGFAIVEGVLNSISALGTPGQWASSVLLRAPATAMHALVSGLIGLGWAAFWQRRRRWILPVTYFISMLFHALWNFSTVGIVASSTLTLDNLGQLTPETMFGSLLVLVSTGMLIILIILAPTLLLGLPWWLRRRGGARAQSGADSAANSAG